MRSYSTATPSFSKRPPKKRYSAARPAKGLRVAGARWISSAADAT
jgi:hypothetical protein